MNPELPGSLEEEVNNLRWRVLRLEQALAANGIALPKPAQTHTAQSAIAAAQQPEPMAATAAREHSVRAPLPSFQPVAAPVQMGRNDSTVLQNDSHSLENRIGSQWFNRVGIVAVLIAVAWFLKLAFDNHWIGPLGRICIGLLAGAGLIGWSERFEKRGFTAFAYALKAIGSGALYLSLWAALSVYALLPAWVAFIAMIAVTAFNGIVSWARDAELLALYAIAGGLSTPLLVSTGGNHEITLFSYLLILDLAVLVLVALKPWSRLLFAAYTGTVVFVAGWWFDFYSQTQAGRTGFFLTCFFLLFAFAPRLVRVKANDRDEFGGWDALVVVILPLANAASGFLAYSGLLTPTASGWAQPWIAVALAAFYLLMLRLPARGVLGAGPMLLSSLHLSIAVVFLTIAIPLKTQGRWLTIGWLAEGAALLWVAARLGQVLIRVFALICLVLGLGALLVLNPTASTMPFFNQRFGTYVVAIAVFAFVAWLAQNNAPRDEAHDPMMSWTYLAGAAVLTINALILVAVGWEIHSYWWRLRWHGDWMQMREYAMYVHFTYSAFFMVFGATLLSVGFWRRSAFLRWQALALVAITIAKVFLVDTSQLSQGFRVLSFLGLGVLLLAVSFAYQRDWLNLRGRGDQTQ